MLTLETSLVVDLSGALGGAVETSTPDAVCLGPGLDLLLAWCGEYDA